MHRSGVDSFEPNLPRLSVCDSQHLFTKSTTYLAKIAVILQDVPDKMLPFRQLIYRLAPLIPANKKSVEGNIRVCLSSNKCFVKIPVALGSKGSNYWKLDTHQITEKMVRRHFREIMDLFPELAPKLIHSPAQVESREVKFSSPFSIESILQTDSPRASPLSSVPFRDRGTMRSLTWDTEDHPSTGLSPVWSVGGSTPHRLGSPVAGATGVKRKKHIRAPSSCLVYSRDRNGHYFNSSPHNRYITYSVQSLVQELYRYRF